METIEDKKVEKVKKIDLDTYFEISRALEQYHTIFYKFWEMGKPRFTDKILTAGVTWNKQGHFVEFLFNPDFWDKLNDQERHFVICHECLHLMLNHGTRQLDAKDKRTCNLPLDVVVNHALVDSFGFVRDALPCTKDACWIDTVFPNRDDILPVQSFEYYYNKLEKQNKKIQLPDNLQTIDSHEGLSDCDMEIIAEELNQQLKDDEKKALENIAKQIRDAKNQLAGDTPLGQIIEVKKEPIIKRNVWKQIIKKFNIKWYNDNHHEQWARINRRLSALQSDLILPSDYEEEDFEKNRVEVWLFLDTSSSCRQLAGKFFNMAKSLPEDYFLVKAFSFDDYVYEVDLKSDGLRGGGGTSFNCIEHYIKKTIKTSKKYKKYPQAVFVITDGMGDEVKPAFPDRWYWFLSEISNDKYIPTESKIYALDEIETGKIGAKK